MKRKDLFSVYSVIEAMLKESKVVKLNFYLLENKKKIKDAIDNIVGSINVTDKYKEYDNLRVELCKKYCSKDSNGVPIIKDDNYVGLDDNEEFSEKLKELIKNNKSTVDEYIKSMKEYNALLDEDVDLGLKKINIELIPNDLITGEMQEILLPLLES